MESSGPEGGIEVDLASVTASVGKEIVVPVNVQGIADKMLFRTSSISGMMRRGLAEPVDVKDTASRGLSVVTNASEPWIVASHRLWSDAYRRYGVLLHLRFTTCRLVPCKKGCPNDFSDSLYLL